MSVDLCGAVQPEYARSLRAKPPRSHRTQADEECGTTSGSGPSGVQCDQSPNASQIDHKSIIKHCVCYQRAHQRYSCRRTAGSTATRLEKWKFLCDPKCWHQPSKDPFFLDEEAEILEREKSSGYEWSCTCSKDTSSYGSCQFPMPLNALTYPTVGAQIRVSLDVMNSWKSSGYDCILEDIRNPWVVTVKLGIERGLARMRV